MEIQIPNGKPFGEYPQAESLAAGDALLVKREDGTGTKRLNLGQVRDFALTPFNENEWKYLHWNDNLLDNWYFVGGGTENNFPINQRGQTSYTSRYGIDRWNLLAGQATGVSCTIQSEFVKLQNDNPSAALYWEQNLGRGFAGCRLALSVLLSNGELYFRSDVVLDNTEWQLRVTFENNNEVYAQNDDNGRLSVVFRVLAGQSLEIVAAKLELGDTQTLAHQENGVWVLNEIPDYGTELAKCKRYYRLWKDEAARTQALKEVGLMRIDNPAVGTIQIDGATHYYATAEL